MTTTKPDCVFCGIGAGQIPSSKIYEDDRCLAFLDINPLAEGHVLLIPKKHAETIDRMDPDDVAALARLFGPLAKAVQEGVGVAGLNILQNNGPCSGQAVFHVHFHFIPRVPGDNLGYRWPAGSYKEGRMQEVHQNILKALKVPRD